MSILDDVIKRGKQIFDQLKYTIPHVPYPDADYYRNLWIIAMKKALREVLRDLDVENRRYVIVQLSTQLNKIIMKLRSTPELYDMYNGLIQAIYEQIVYNHVYIQAFEVLSVKDKTTAYVLRKLTAFDSVSVKDSVKLITVTSVTDYTSISDLFKHIVIHTAKISDSLNVTDLPKLSTISSFISVVKTADTFEFFKPSPSFILDYTKPSDCVKVYVSYKGWGIIRWGIDMWGV